MIVVRNIFAFCDVELEAQRKKDPSFCSEFSVIALCSRVILWKKISKKQSWVYSFIHVGILPGKKMSVYGDVGLRPAVCSWGLLCSSGWLRSFDLFALACLRLGVQVVTTLLCYTAVVLETLREQIRSTWDRPEEEQNCVFVRIKRLWTVLLSVVSSLSSVTSSVHERLRLWYHFLELEKETNLYWDLDF